MPIQPLSVPSTDLMNNFMEAMSHRQAERRSSAPPPMSSPETCASSLLDDPFDTNADTPNLTALMLPSSVAEESSVDEHRPSGATVISNLSALSPRIAPTKNQTDGLPSVIITSQSQSDIKADSSRKSSSDRRHSLPSSLVLSRSPPGDAVTHPVPEFLCHLFSMLRDPELSKYISWAVPTQDEPDHLGGGMKGIGKIVVHNPEALQDIVLGKYYRHSKYASFQRQLNYFGFKKRLHGGKKGKLSPCSFVHEKLSPDPESLLHLKRRPPAKKRNSMDDAMDSADSVSSNEDKNNLTEVPTSKKQRVAVKKSAKGKQNQGAKATVAPPKPVQVKAEDFGPPMTVSFAQRAAPPRAVPPPFVAAAHLKKQNLRPDAPKSFSSIGVAAPVTPTGLPMAPTYFPIRRASAPSVAPTSMLKNSLPNHAHTISTKTAPKPTKGPATAAADKSLFDLLSTCLPPSDVLFDDDFSDLANAEELSKGVWVTDDGKNLSHNSLVDLAMFY